MGVGVLPRWMDFSALSSGVLISGQQSNYNTDAPLSVNITFVLVPPKRGNCRGWRRTICRLPHKFLTLSRPAGQYSTLEHNRGHTLLPQRLSIACSSTIHFPLTKKSCPVPPAVIRRAVAQRKRGAEPGLSQGSARKPSFTPWRSPKLPLACEAMRVFWTGTLAQASKCERPWRSDP
jgi:hypothetical protein